MAAEKVREDASLRLSIDLEDPKQKMKPPNKKKFDEDMDSLQSQIKEKEIIYERLKANSTDSKSVELERKSTIDRRKKLVAELEKLNKSLPEKVHRLNELKSSLVYRHEDKINNAISQLEWNLSAKTFKLTEEKKIVSEIDRLKRSKKTLVHYRALDQEINGIRDRQRAMREERDIFSKTISNLKSREEVMRQSYQKSKTIKLEIDNLYEQKRQLNASFKRQKEEFKDVKKQRKESMKKKEEERRAHVKVRQKERVEMETEKLPHEPELHLCHTLITYLGRFGPAMQDSGQEGVSPASSQADDHEPAEEMDDGQYVLLRKSDESEDLDLSIGLNRSRRRNRRSRKQSMVKKITHSTDVLSHFVALNLNAPSTLLEVGEVVDQLHKKKAFYEREQQLMESASDAGFSLTESMMCEMSRQASKTESCEGGGQDSTCPDESVYSDLLKACRDDPADAPDWQRATSDELLGAIGGAAEPEWSDSPTPKSDSQNSDSTIEGDNGNGSQVLVIDPISRSPDNCQSRDNKDLRGRQSPKRSLSPKASLQLRDSFSSLAPWATGSSGPSPQSGDGQNFLAVPGLERSIRHKSDPSPVAHQPLQKTQSLQPSANTVIKSYAHSVVGRTQSFSSSTQLKKPQTQDHPLGKRQSQQPCPPSSLLLNVPLTASLNLPSPTKRPLSRSKTMTPTEGNKWKERGAWASRVEANPRSPGAISPAAHSDWEQSKSPSASLSSRHALKSPVSPRRSFPLPSDLASASQSTSSTVLDQDFPTLSQAASSLRRSSNLSTKSSNGSQCHDVIGKTSPASTPSSSKNVHQQPLSSQPDSAFQATQSATPTGIEMVSSVKQIPGKDKSATELWVQSSMAFVQDEAVQDTSTTPLRESTRL